MFLTLVAAPGPMPNTIAATGSCTTPFTLELLSSTNAVLDTHPVTAAGTFNVTFTVSGPGTYTVHPVGAGKEDDKEVTVTGGPIIP